MLTDTSTQPAATAGITAPSGKRTLYDISTDYYEFEQLIESIDDDITSEDAAALDRWLERLDEERDKKLEATGHIIARFKTRGEARVEEGRRIQRLGEIDLNKVKFLKQRLLGFFQFHNITDAINTLRFKFKKCGNGGVMPVELSEDAQNNPVNLPEKYRAVRYEPRLDIIREDLITRAQIEKILKARDAMKRKLDIAFPLPKEQAEYDELSRFIAELGEPFVKQVLKFSPEDFESMEIQLNDLNALLDGVGELGERGERLRIS